MDLILELTMPIRKSIQRFIYLTGRNLLLNGQFKNQLVIAALATGDPDFAVGAFKCCSAIIEG
jgi:hypothetical protein